MKRRGFLKLLAGTVAAPLALKLLPALPAETASTFGLASVKAEGAAVAFDQAIGANFTKGAWPGIAKWYGAVYAACPPEYKDIFERKEF